MRVKGEAKVINVTGSAKKRIESDLVVWKGRILVNDKDLVAGYNALQAATDRTTAYLRAQGVPDAQVTVSAVGGSSAAAGSANATNSANSAGASPDCAGCR